MAKRILMVLTALAALTLSFSSCNKDKNNGGGGKKPSTDIRMSVKPGEVKLMVGKTAQLTVTINPEDTKYSFKTSNAEIATVSETGLVTAVAEGETVITVTAGNVEKTAKVKVVPASAISDSDYIGILEDPKLAKHVPPIYVPKAEMLKKENMDLYKEAMTSKGWEYKPFESDPDGNKAFPFVCPKQNEKDWRIYSFSYIHTPTDGDAFMYGLQGVYSADPIVENAEGDLAEVQKLLASLAQAYGFVEKFNLYKTDKGMYYMAGYNLKVADRPLLIMIYSDNKTSDTGEVYYPVFCQVTYDAPKAQQSLEQHIHGSIKDMDVDYSMLLKRMK